MKSGAQFRSIDVSSVSSFFISVATNIGIVCGKLRLLAKEGAVETHAKSFLTLVKTSLNKPATPPDAPPCTELSHDVIPSSSEASEQPLPQTESATESITEPREPDIPSSESAPDQINQPEIWTYESLQAKTKIQLKGLLENYGVTDIPSSSTKDDLISDILKRQNHPAPEND